MNACCDAVEADGTLGAADLLLSIIISRLAVSSKVISILRELSAPASRKLFLSSSPYSFSNLSAASLLRRYIFITSPSLETDSIMEKLRSARVRLSSPCIIEMQIMRALVHSPSETGSRLLLFIKPLIPCCP